MRYQERRILVWAKTEPEPSIKYVETVCTGGVFEDGRPVRLYPIPLRYLDDKARFSRYQWITARITRDPHDPRPESHRIDYDSIEIGEQIPTDSEEWTARGNVLFKDPSWQFDSVDDLLNAQRDSGRSIGVVAPREIIDVTMHVRPAEDFATFQAKQAGIARRVNHDRSQSRMFAGFKPPPPVKQLNFTEARIQVHWVCGAGKRHAMQIIDWEVIELVRKIGNDRALQAVKGYLDLTSYAIKFFLGNLRRYPNRFMIGGIWYPKKRAKSLFDGLVEIGIR